MDTSSTARTRMLIAGALAGAFAGLALTALAGGGTASRLAERPPESRIEATHFPPLLTTERESVTLRYDAYCLGGPEEDPDVVCDLDGTVFVRAGEVGAFTPVTLELDPSVEEGRWTAVVPERIARARSGFTYYAVLRDRSTGAEVTLPAGAAEAPQRSHRLDRAVEVALGAHAFGLPRSADARVFRAAWGRGATEVGLETGRNLPPIGGSSFDVGPDGIVSLLDQANGRLLRVRPRARMPESVRLAIGGSLADLAVTDDGTIYVLESATSSRGDVLRAFHPNGALRGEVEVAERASQVRIDPSGEAMVHQQPSGQWMRAGTADRLRGVAQQRASGRPGRALRGGEEVVVLRRDAEIRVAVVSRQGVRRSWRITSETPLAEVQLVEPVGDLMLVVVRAYADGRDEFVALVLGARGLVRTFSLASADWAETAPLSRFRVRGSSLYQLGSTPAGVFVDRFDLEE